MLFSYETIGKLGMINSTNVLGISVSTLSRERIVNEIDEMVKSYRKDLRSRYVATLNMDFLSNCLNFLSLKLKNSRLYKTLQNSDLVTPDGMPVVLMAKLKNVKMSGRVTGADLVYDIANMAEKKNYSIYFIGRDEKLCHDAAEVLKDKNPGLKIAGWSCPVVDQNGQVVGEREKDNKALVDSINSSGADILYIGLGNPKQELWFENYKKQLKVAVSIGVGGSLNFITGQVKRAPLILQKVGMEWLFRLYSEPKRLWKRYLSQIILLSTLLVRGRLKISSYFIKKFKLDRNVKWPFEFKNGALTFSGILTSNSMEKCNKLIKNEEVKVIDFEKVINIEENAVKGLVNLISSQSHGPTLKGLNNRSLVKIKGLCRVKDSANSEAA